MNLTSNGQDSLRVALLVRALFHAASPAGLLAPTVEILHG